jgi:4-hydroxybenzoate polyprenyltransferase
MVIHAWNRMLRIPNVCMIILIQFLLFTRFMIPSFPVNDLELSFIESILVLLALLCITISGYVVNNIYDAEIDTLNVQKAIIPKYFSVAFSWRLYWILVIVGFLSSVYVSIHTEFYYSLILYPCSVFLLWYYSYQLKCVPLLGNILISLFTGGLVLLIPYLYWNNLEELRSVDFSSWSTLMYKWIMLFVFAVLSNLTREILKDIEDMHEDRIYECSSTGNYFGFCKSKIMILCIWFAFIIICISVFWSLSSTLDYFFYIIAICIPALYFLILFIQMHEQSNFRKLSKFLKMYMATGILYWCLLY